MKRNITFAALLLLLGLGISPLAHAEVTLLNVSYDPTREFYQAYNVIFQNYWKQKTGEDVRVRQSHGGSAKQARAVIDGLRADVVTLALAYDIDVIAQHPYPHAAIPKNWQTLLPNNSCPYTSTIVFLVRKGNPKAINDWGDLIKDGVEVITPNPKTSGGARWNYLAAYGYAIKKFSGDEAKAVDYMKQLFAHVPVLDAGARGATTTFVQRGIGDVLLTWENEAYLALNELGKDKFDIVTPPTSILTEPPVAVVERSKPSPAAKAYLSHLYSPEAQELIAQHYYRPQDKAVALKYKTRFPTISMMTINDFGGWDAVQKKHFDDGGVFDQLSKK